MLQARVDTPNTCRSGVPEHIVARELNFESLRCNTNSGIVVGNSFLAFRTVVGNRSRTEPFRGMFFNAPTKRRARA